MQTDNTVITGLQQINIIFCLNHTYIVFRNNYSFNLLYLN